MKNRNLEFLRNTENLAKKQLVVDNFLIDHQTEKLVDGNFTYSGDTSTIVLNKTLYIPNEVAVAYSSLEEKIGDTNNRKVLEALCVIPTTIFKTVNLFQLPNYLGIQNIDDEQYYVKPQSQLGVEFYSQILETLEDAFILGIYLINQPEDEQKRFTKDFKRIINHSNFIANLDKLTKLVNDSDIMRYLFDKNQNVKKELQDLTIKSFMKVYKDIDEDISTFYEYYKKASTDRREKKINTILDSQTVSTKVEQNRGENNGS